MFMCNYSSWLADVARCQNGQAATHLLCRQRPKGMAGVAPLAPFISETQRANSRECQPVILCYFCRRYCFVVLCPCSIEELFCHPAPTFCLKPEFKRGIHPLAFEWPILGGKYEITAPTLLTVSLVLLIRKGGCGIWKTSSRDAGGQQ